MQEFVHKLFSENNSDLSIHLFDIWHILYLLIIFGMTLILSIVFRKKENSKKEKIIELFCYLTIGLYIADFFIMPLSDSYDGISVYKLPFNICTIMAVLVPFAQFNKRFSKIKHVIVILSIASSLMWMCYPGSALGGEPPFSYIIFQTFMYHGFLFTWGVLSLTLGGVTLEIKKCYQVLIGILLILVWAAFGNEIYEGEQNWFFIEKSIFPFLQDQIMPVMVVLSVFGVCLIIYGIYYLIKKVYNKLENKAS